MGLKWIKRSQVVVSKETIEDAIKDGVLKKVNQQLLSKETGIAIKTFVGGQKKKRK